VATKKKADKPVEKVASLGLARDNTQFLYFIDRQGNVVRMSRGTAKAKTDILVPNAVVRAKGYDYFVDDDGDVAREAE
jgi:hypothetical protein